MENAIELEGVEKRFGAKVAVDGLSLEVPRGCIYGFLGPNGAGKTTTLRMIIGIFYPDGLVCAETCVCCRTVGFHTHAILEIRLTAMHSGIFSHIRHRDKFSPHSILQARCKILAE